MTSKTKETRLRSCLSPLEERETKDGLLVGREAWDREQAEGGRPRAVK